MPDSKLEYTVLDLFSHKAFGGCPVGVLTSAGMLEPWQMQSMASELGTPRTAFVTGGAAGVFNAMFFTPSHRLAHSTMAAMGAAVVIHRQETEAPRDKPQAIAFSTTSIDIKTKVTPLPDAETFSIDAFLPRPSFAPFGYNLALLSGALGTRQENIPPSWPLGLAFAGTWNLVVPMVTAEAMKEARPDSESLSDLTRKLQCQSAILYSHSGPNEIKCRTLSPGIGLPQQSMSVTALGSVCSLLVRESAVEPGSPETIISARQQMGAREPEARIQVYGSNEQITTIQIGGSCIEVAKGKMKIPAGNEDLS